MTLLKLEHVTKRFAGLVAVNDVSFSVDKGEIVGIIGPNGAGKTTLFHTISGYHVADEGVIEYKGKNIRGLKPEIICEHGIARTFQIVQPFGNLTLLENVIVGAFNRHKKYSEAKAVAMEMLEFVGMKKRADVRMKDLTFPEQKKVELARALATEPELLFLDEIMSGLNPTEVQEMIEIIKEIRDRGITIMFIEHLMAAVMSLSERIIVMHHGEVLAIGKPEEVKENPAVIEAYLGGAV